MPYIFFSLYLLASFIFPPSFYLAAPSHTFFIFLSFLQYSPGAAGTSETFAGWTPKDLLHNHIGWRKIIFQKCRNPFLPSQPKPAFIYLFFLDSFLLLRSRRGFGSGWLRRGRLPVPFRHDFSFIFVSVTSLFQFRCGDLFAGIRASSSRGQGCGEEDEEEEEEQPSCPRAAVPGTRGQGAVLIPSGISPSEPSQAPKPNQRVYVPQGGFSLIDGFPGFVLPTSSSSFPGNLQV